MAAEPPHVVAHFFEVDLKEIHEWCERDVAPPWVEEYIEDVEALLASWAEFQRLFGV